MANFKIVVLPGDGIGPEVTREAVKALKAIGNKYGHIFEMDEQLMGGVSIDKTGEALTKDVLKRCNNADAVLLGAVGDPKFDVPTAMVRPEDGLLDLRKGMGLYANLRPVKVLPMLADQTNLKPEVIRGVDLMVVRELTGGLYFGKPKRRYTTSRGRRAVDTMSYSEQEIVRIAMVGFELARSRKKKLMSVDKQNVLQTSRLWREVVMEVAKEYPDIELEHQLVDSCAMRLIQNPKSIDVIVTENTFGDILTDEASMLAGSMGMLPSASLAGTPKEGTKIQGMYEPIHGSAPRRANQNLANPIATILSAAMLLRHSLNLPTEAKSIEDAVMAVLVDGYRTYDIYTEGMKKVGTREMGDQIAAGI
ncbi:MAG: 3-isopropylmalate dehydrogenase [Chloroflexi bacterium RBG_13_46_9]|nr:MAG: 3-isopropylmalate dehydrogenase [Chloroflexi bacterium RBG_13_46_9]